MATTVDPYVTQLSSAGLWLVLDDTQPTGEPEAAEPRHARLRPTLLEDAPALLDLLGDVGVTRFFIWHPPRTLDQARTYIRGFQYEMAGGNAYHFTVLAMPGEEPAGIINLYHLEPRRSPLSTVPGRAEIGIWIGRPYWGTGVGPSACRTLLRFAFDEIGFDEVVFRTQPVNRRACRVFERLGASPIGWKELHCQREGRPLQHLVYRVRAGEFRR